MSGRALPATMMCVASSIRGQAIFFPLTRSNCSVTTAGRLEARAAHLAVALRGVDVAEVEERPVVEDRQVDGRALADVGRVHVAAEGTGPEAAERLLAGRRDRDPSEHRLERDLDALRLAEFGRSRMPTLRARSSVPDEAARRAAGR